MIMIKKLNETNSTNSYLKELVHVQLGQSPQTKSISKCIPEFFSVMANSQTNGRGQHECQWHSEPSKNALFSTLMFPKIHPSQQFYISKVVSLSIIDYLKTQIPDHKNLSIKWPNDIYYKDKKLAGILIENSIMGEEILYSVIGIGLNLNQQHFDSQLPNPISVSQITELTYDVEDAVKTIINNISFRYAIIVEDIVAYDFEYEQLLYKKNLEFEYEINNQKFLARIKGVNEYGKLLLLKNNCEMLECAFKEVKFL
jgi:BirA family biotin operon repressor/biotin-[acetyl-CoA-carboxylase] ligase